jgi:hypothetical protein
MLWMPFQISIPKEQIFHELFPYKSKQSQNIEKFGIFVSYRGKTQTKMLTPHQSVI